MAERIVLLVTTLLAVACAPEFPRDLSIDDRFDAAEEQHIVLMIDELNRVGRELVGHDLVVYKGRYRDDDQWDLDNADDGHNVIYKQVSRDANYDYVNSTANEPAEGGYVAGLE